MKEFITGLTANTQIHKILHNLRSGIFYDSGAISSQFQLSIIPLSVHKNCPKTDITIKTQIKQIPAAITGTKINISYYNMKPYLSLPVCNKLTRKPLNFPNILNINNKSSDFLLIPPLNGFFLGQAPLSDTLKNTEVPTVNINTWTWVLMELEWELGWEDCKWTILKKFKKKTVKEILS